LCRGCVLAWSDELEVRCDIGESSPIHSKGKDVVGLPLRAEYVQRRIQDRREEQGD
jgi:hypothetical protein